MTEQQRKIAGVAGALVYGAREPIELCFVHTTEAAEPVAV